MQFLDLFLVALMPVLKVILVTAIGLFLALDRINLLGPSARNHLNNLVFYVFNPAIIAGYLAETITWESLVTLWFMPVNLLLTTIIGSALGWLLVKITGTPQQLRSLVIGVCSAGNVGSLFLIILPALCEEQNNPFGDSSTCSTYAYSYASLSMAFGNVYLWTYVYIIMRVSANNQIKESETNDSTNIDVPGETSDVLAAPVNNVTEPFLPGSENYTDQVVEPLHNTTAARVKVEILEKITQYVKRIAEKINLKMILTPSTIAAIIGLIIGIVSPIRKTIIGDSAPLRVIYSSTALLGEAAIPSVTLIIGANLLKGLQSSGVGATVVIGIIAVKYIIMPPLGILVVKAAQEFRFVNSNSLYQFSLLLQYAVPPAMNIGIITQLVQTGQSECSVVMLWTYAVATFFLTLWSGFFLWLVA